MTRDEETFFSLLGPQKSQSLGPAKSWNVSRESMWRNGHAQSHSVVSALLWCVFYASFSSGNFGKNLPWFLFNFVGGLKLESTYFWRPLIYSNLYVYMLEPNVVQKVNLKTPDRSFSSKLMDTYLTKIQKWYCTVERILFCVTVNPKFIYRYWTALEQDYP